MTMLIKAHKLINQKLPKISEMLLKSSPSNWSKIGVSTCGLLQGKPPSSLHMQGHTSGHFCDMCIAWFHKCYGRRFCIYIVLRSTNFLALQEDHTELALTHY